MIRKFFTLAVLVGSLNACAYNYNLEDRDKIWMEYHYANWYEEVKKCLIDNGHKPKGDYKRIEWMLVPDLKLKNKEGKLMAGGWGKITDTKTFIKLAYSHRLKKHTVWHEMIHELTEKGHGKAFADCDFPYTKTLYEIDYAI